METLLVLLAATGMAAILVLMAPMIFDIYCKIGMNGFSELIERRKKTMKKQRKEDELNTKIDNLIYEKEKLKEEVNRLKKEYNPKEMKKKEILESLEHTLLTLNNEIFFIKYTHGYKTLSASNRLKKSELIPFFKGVEYALENYYSTDLPIVVQDRKILEEVLKEEYLEKKERD